MKMLIYRTERRNKAHYKHLYINT